MFYFSFKIETVNGWIDLKFILSSDQALILVIQHMTSR